MASWPPASSNNHDVYNDPTDRRRADQALRVKRFTVCRPPTTATGAKKNRSEASFLNRFVCRFAAKRSEEQQVIDMQDHVGQGKENVRE